MNVMEAGRRLQEMANEVVSASRAPRGNAVGALADAANYLEQCREAVEFPTNEVAEMLGEEHSGTTSILEATGLAQEKIESMQERVRALLAEMEDLPGVLDQVGWAYMTTGAAIMGQSG